MVKNHNKKWTQTEINFLKNNKLNMSFDDLAIALKRTRKAVSQKCKDLRFVRPKYYLDLSLTPSLAYILGCLCGDASISDNWVRLTVKDKDFADEFYKHCKNLLDKYYIKLSRFIDKRGMYYVSVGSLAFKNFILKNYGDFRTFTWKIPKIIFNSNSNIIRHFLKGYFDSEGNFHSTYIRLQTINKNIKSITDLLAKLSIDCTLHIENRKTIKNNPIYTLRIHKEKNINLFKKQIGFSIQRKQQRVLEYLKRRNNQRSKSKRLWKSKKRMAELFRQGHSLQKIAYEFNVISLNTISKYVQMVLREDYSKYKHNQNIKVINSA